MIRNDLETLVSMASSFLRSHQQHVYQLVHFNTNNKDDLYRQDLTIVWSNKLVRTDLSKYLIVRCRKHTKALNLFHPYRYSTLELFRLTIIKVFSKLCALYSVYLSSVHLAVLRAVLRAVSVSTKSTPSV